MSKSAIKQRREAAKAAAQSEKPGLDWCKKIFNAIEPKITAAIPEADIEKEPEWVVNLVTELSQQSLPAFRIKNCHGYFPRETGLMLGQRCAFLYALGERYTEPTEQQNQRAEKALKILEQNRDKPAVESVLMGTDLAMRLLGELVEQYPDFEKAVHEAFRAALDQTNYRHAVEFFQGFAVGLAKPGITNDGLAGRTEATNIYLRLYTHRREIEKMKDFPAVHSFLLDKCGMLKHQLRSVRRLQKIGERLGLHLAKPGRPRAS